MTYVVTNTIANNKGTIGPSHTDVDAQDSNVQVLDNATGTMMTLKDYKAKYPCYTKTWNTDTECHKK